MILVTGATTHTGSKLVHYLVENGEKVRCLVHDESHLKYLPDKGEETVFGDLKDVSFLLKAFEGVAAVINIAHISFAPYIIDACNKANIKRVVFVSSTRRFTKFSSESAKVVIDAEEKIQNSNLDYTIVRPSMIYGDERDNNITHLVNYIKKHSFLPMIGNGKNLVQPIYVWDLVKTIYSIIKKDITIRKAYTLAGPEPIAYKDMIQIIAKNLGEKIVIFYMPYAISLMIAKIYAKLSPKPLLTVEQIQRFGEDRIFDITDAKRDIDFNPIPFSEGIQYKLHGKV